MTRQTISFLTKRFEGVGIRPDTRKGQNFLIDLNLLELLADSAELSPQDVVLEIGSGTGSLTALLSRKCAAVVSIEIDVRVHQLASEELIDCENVTLLRLDALKNKNHFHPDVLAAVHEQLAKDPSRRFKLAANLPYNVATPIISNLLLTDVTPDLMAVTIQKELADRMIAKPRTKDYGSVSVWLQSLCDTQIIRVLPPSVFWPRPKVHSAIIQVRPNPEKRAQIQDLAFYHKFVRSIFFHRRKFLRSVILSGYKGQLTKPQVDEILAELGLPGESRAEELDVPMMQRLCETIRSRVS